MRAIFSYKTVLGEISIAENDGFITNLYFESDDIPIGVEMCETQVIKKAYQELESYLKGERAVFTLPLAPAGTEFMKEVWEKLCEIPYGKTASYQEIAVRVGSPKAARAVGLANNRNPIPVFIPCHRVIGADGNLVGYGGGLALKEILLQVEKSNIFYQYGQVEIEYLKKKDKKLGQAIDKIGMIVRKVNPDIFASIVSSIVGQQISGKAARAIWGRLLELLGEITPESIFRADVESIRNCGVSMKKALYIKGVSRAVLNGEFDFTKFDKMSDDEIVKKLSALQGVGVWTAEMTLIFSMRRPDVVSWGDLAIRRGMMNLYGLKELTKEQFEKYKKRYSPYGTVASLYLWELSSVTGQEGE